ncbi:MAG: amidase [Candidatus Helarchaeota archaeon]
MTNNDFFFKSAYELKELIKTQEITAEEITEKFIERIEKINPLINAYCVKTFDMAREQAKKADNAVKNNDKLGLLNGIPTSIKDLMEMKAVRTTFGSKIYEHYVPEEDEEVIKRLKNAGCVILGKTNVPEFGHYYKSYNFIYGATHNPWDLSCTSGGSSGGAAAAVASGLGPLALGSDGAGSIRIPSSFCGLYGLKPTIGRIPHYPRSMHMWWTMEHYGPIVRYVKDAALMLDVMQGAHSGDIMSIPKQVPSYFNLIDEIPKKLKVGYSTTLGYIKALDSEVKEKVINGAQRFEELNWDVEEVKIKLRNVELHGTTLITTGYAKDLGSQLKKWEDQLTPDLVSLIKAGLNTNAMDLEKAYEFQQKVLQKMHEFFKVYDILITPTTPATAFDLDIEYPSDIGGRRGTPLSMISFTTPWNLSGIPAASIPCGWTSSGLPIGMQIIGNRFNELLVLQVSKAFEELAPWQDKKPIFN